MKKIEKFTQFAFRLKQIVVVLVLPFLLPFSVFGQSETKELSAKLILDYKIQTTHFLSSTVVQEKIRKEVLIAANNIDTQCTDTLHLFYQSEDIAIQVFRQIVKGDTSDPDLFYDSFVLHSYLNDFELHKSNFAKDFVITFRKIARLHGVSVAVVWFSTEMAQIITIGYLTSIGYPEIAALAPVFPLSFFNTGVAIYIKSLRHNNKLRKGYGLRAKRKTGQKIIRETNRKFKIKNKNSFVHVLDEQGDSAVLTTINKNNILIDVGSFFKLNKNKLYYRNVKRYAHKNLSKTSLDSINKKSFRKLDKQLRVIMYLEMLREHDSAYSELTARFKKSVYKLPLSEINKCSYEAKKWVYTALELKDFSEFPALVNQIPESLYVEEVLDYFEKIILPYWSENLKKVGFRKFRTIVKGINQTRYDTLKISNHNWNKATSNVLMSNCI